MCWRVSVLLAITGVLVLTGCKNDTVPEPTGGGSMKVHSFPAELKTLTDYTSPNHTDSS